MADPDLCVGQAMRTGARQLATAGIDGALRDARLLMAHTLGIEGGRLVLFEHDKIDRHTLDQFHGLIDRRTARVPLSHLVGYRLFYGRDFRVSPSVLDPRPETETLIAAALDVPFSRILDLGTGSGAILLTLLAENQRAKGLGSDKSAKALNVARTNAQALGVEGRVTFIESDWYHAIDGEFDLIVSNPPYIALDEMPELAPELNHEPRMALTDEGDGLSAYRAIAKNVCQHLCPGGWLMVEIGWQQGVAVTQIFRDAGLGMVAILPDLDGRDRVVIGKLPESV